MQDSHSDVQEVHLCDLGEVDYWAVVNRQYEFPELMWRHPYKVGDHYTHETLENAEHSLRQNSGHL